MIVEIRLFGAFRDLEPSGKIAIELNESADVAALRTAIDQYGNSHWATRYKPALLKVSAISSDTEILHDSKPIKDQKGLAILPPVSGG